MNSGKIPPLDAYEWSEDGSDDLSYAYVASEVTSSMPPERENNRVLTPEVSNKCSNLLFICS